MNLIRTGNSLRKLIESWIESGNYCGNFLEAYGSEFLTTEKILGASEFRTLPAERRRNLRVLAQNLLIPLALLGEKELHVLAGAGQETLRKLNVYSSYSLNEQKRAVLSTARAFVKHAGKR